MTVVNTEERRDASSALAQSLSSMIELESWVRVLSWSIEFDASAAPSAMGYGGSTSLQLESAVLVFSWSLELYIGAPPAALAYVGNTPASTRGVWRQG